MAISIQVVMDCHDPSRLAAFWATTLGYKLQDPPSGFDSWPAFLAAQGVPSDEWNSASAIVDPEGQGPRIYFQRVPEPKIVKNRLHLDVNASGSSDLSPDERRARIDTAVARLVKEGATRLRAGTTGRVLGGAGRSRRKRVLRPMMRRVARRGDAGDGNSLLCCTGLCRTI